MIYSFIKNQFYQRSKKILYQYSKKNSRKNLYEFIEKALDEYEIISFEKTLNIGAGGEIGKLLSNKLIYAPTTLDIDENYNPDIVCSVENMKEIANDTFDAVFLFEVLSLIFWYIVLP